MSRQYFNSNIQVEKDEFKIPDVGHWSLEKWKLLGRCLDITTHAMYKKWKLVYIDLYCGSGYARIRGSNNYFKTSPLIALSLPQKFNKYIFCDVDPDAIASLQKRVRREFPDADCTFILGDANEVVYDVIKELDQFASGSGILPFCFIDPYEMNIKFSTVQNLICAPAAKGRMDILILKALQMDAKRGYAPYSKTANLKIDHFIDNPNWRNEYVHIDAKSFARFIASQYTKRMKDLGYKSDNEHFYEIKNIERNQSLYYLVYYSKHPLGYIFYDKAEKGASNQGKFDF